jgi:hypothetical protein
LDRDPHYNVSAVEDLADQGDLFDNGEGADAIADQAAPVP